MRILIGLTGVLFACFAMQAADDVRKPYSAPCVERENVFEFAEKPSVKTVGPDKYEITFASKGSCDVTVAIVGPDGKVVRHLGCGVLGSNAPAPFQKNSLKQVIYWNGKDDLGDYVKEPGKMQVRVMLGLKPTFEKLLGATNPKNLPGVVIALVAGPDGAYVFCKGQGAFGHASIRKFDHDGNYVQSLVPPPTSLPEEKVAGMGCIEYEPGRRTVFGPIIVHDFLYEGGVLPTFNENSVETAQPVLSGNKLFMCNGGSSYFTGTSSSKLFYIYADGSTDLPGTEGRPLIPWHGASHLNPRFAASPDGKWLYMTGPAPQHSGSVAPALFRRATDGDKPADVFIGDAKNAGSDNNHFNAPLGLECDTQGRIYVADSFNNRIQIFSPDGKFLKSIPSDRPSLLRIHQKTGAIYVQHCGEVRGQTVGRLSKLKSFDDPAEEFHVDGFSASVMALDSWTAKPRLWLSGGGDKLSATKDGLTVSAWPSVTVWQEDAGTLKKIVDFDEEVKKEAGSKYHGRWSGSVFDHVVCDPNRNQLYLGWGGSRQVFDLETGNVLYNLTLHGAVDDVAFDKRGYMHCHLNPGFFMPGVVRLDPSQAATYKDWMGRPQKGTMAYKEVPYDYGVEISKPQSHGWMGALPVKDQPGAKFFQDGFGVNMFGDVAVGSYIYYVPKMEDEGYKVGFAGKVTRMAGGGASWQDGDPYANYMRSIQEKIRLGEEVYFIPRKPGNALAGGTIWTYNNTGELRQECAVITGNLLLATQIDEDGFLYFANDRSKIIGGKPFLWNCGGNFGTNQPPAASRANKSPFTGVWVKAKPKDVRWLLKDAAVPIEPPPARTPDLIGHEPFGFHQGEAWVENVEWIYGGATPLALGCTCPSMRPCIDWYKRSFVTEAYRHSIGILDTNGNLIMHVGRYGNLDNGNGPNSKFPLGGDNISMYLPRFLSTTDDRLCFDDWGERLVVLKLAYQAEESVGVK